VNVKPDDKLSKHVFPYMHLFSIQHVVILLETHITPPQHVPDGTHTLSPVGDDVFVQQTVPEGQHPPLQQSLDGSQQMAPRFSPVIGSTFSEHTLSVGILVSQPHDSLNVQFPLIQHEIFEVGQQELLQHVAVDGQSEFCEQHANGGEQSGPKVETRGPTLQHT